MVTANLISEPLASTDTDSLSGLLEFYRKHGHDLGYHQALRDQLEGLVLQAELFLRARDASSETRQVLYAFVAQLERYLQRQSPLLAHTFQDGAGI